MKKLISIISVVLLAFSAGCDKIEDKSANADVEEQNEAVTEATETTLPERDRKAPAKKGEYLIDEAGVLSNEDFNKINEYAAWFTKTFRINTGVVVTDNLDGKAPKDMATEYHSDIFGYSNGLLLLINNDTGKDYVMRKGSPSLFVTDEDIQLLLADISPLLVTGDYYGAVTKTFELFENNIPEYITDRTNTLSKEDILTVNEMLEKACGENEKLYIIYTKTSSEDFEKYADGEAAKCIWSYSGSAAVLFVNPENGVSTMRVTGGFEPLGEARKLFETAVADYFVKEGGEPVGLAELYINFAGK